MNLLNPPLSPDTRPSRVSEREIGGIRWCYRVHGNGPRTLVALPGAVAGGSLGLRLSRLLDGQYRVVAPVYPAIDTIDAWIRGLAELLDSEGVSELALLGGSFGGLLAQCFVRSFPHRVSRLILAGTGTPSPERAERNRRFVPYLGFVPMSGIRWTLKIAGWLLSRKANDPDIFDPAAFRREIDELTRQDLLSRYRLAIDFDSGQTFTARDVPAGLPILLLDGAEDRVAHGERSKLLALYPHSQAHLFEGAGHTAPLTCAAQWNREVRHFLTSSTD